MTSQAIDWVALEQERNRRLREHREERAKRDLIYRAYLHGAKTMQLQCANEIRNCVAGLIKDSKVITETDVASFHLLQGLFRRIGEITPNDPLPYELPTVEDVLNSVKEDKDA